MKKSLVGLIVAVGISFVVIGLWFTGVLDMLENKVMDLHFSIRGPITPAKDIVIVEIDEDSFTKLGIWPWSRSVHGKLVKTLTAAGAKAVVFDILFFEEDKNNPLGDKEFSNIAKATKNVAVCSYFQSDEQGGAEKLKLPIKVIQENVTVGFANVFPELDGLNRKVPIVKDFEGESIISLPLAGLSIMLNKKPADVLKDYDVKMDEYSEVIVNFCGGFKTFPYYSYYKVINGEYDPKEFKDKLVLVGGTASGLFDFKAVTYSPHFPGVEIHANTMSNILNRNFLTPWMPLATIILIICFAFIASLFFGNLPGWKGGVSAIAVFIGYFFLTHLLFKSNILAEFVAPALSLSLSYVIVLFYRFMSEEKEKRQIKKSFAQYLSPGVLDQILNDPAALALGGQKKNVTIMFSDIRSFTSISEGMASQEVVAFLNEYLSRMVSIVFKHDGTLDKFIGDAVMAVWGAPIPCVDHHKKAVECAIEMIEEVEKLNAKWIAEGKKPIKIGVGINSGEVTIGNIGSEQRKEYTVIGDSVNLASRLEGINKEYRTVIIISGNTYEFVKDYVETEHLGGVKVKGKAQAVDIYGVFGLKGNTNRDIFRLPDTGKHEKVSDKEHAEVVTPAKKKTEPEKEVKSEKFDPEARVEFPKGSHKS